MKTQEVATQIARMSPDAAGVLAACMEANARHADWLSNTIRSGIERERDEWRDRALAAEERLARIEARIWNLLD